MTENCKCGKPADLWLNDVPMCKQCNDNWHDLAICDTETCNNEATHIDQVQNPICTECVNTAIGIGEDEGNFMLMSGKSFTEMSKAGLESLKNDDSIIENAVLSSGNDSELINPIGDAGTGAPVSELTVFEESLTESGLSLIRIQASVLPTIAKNERDYDTVYELSTRLKRVSVAARKKGKAIIGELKTQFNDAKSKVEKDLGYVLGIVDPIITNTVKSRDYMECWIEAKKEKKAISLAATAATEQSRIHIHAVYDQAHAENAQRDIRIKKIADDKIKREAEAERVKNDAAKLKAKQTKLDYDIHVFDCEKTRLSESHAWEYAKIHFTKWISQEQLDEMLGFDGKIDEMLEDVTEDDVKQAKTELTSGYVVFNSPNIEDDQIQFTESDKTENGPSPTDSDIETLKEFVKDEPAEPVETAAYADASTGIVITNPDACNLVLSTETAALADDKQKIKNILAYMDMTLNNLNDHQNQGFESQTVSDAMYQLINDVHTAVNDFTRAVTPSEPPISDDDAIIDDITEDDCPF